MKKKNYGKKIVSAIITIVLSLVLMTGSTLALFGDNDQVDVTVKGAKVSVSATLNNDSLKAYSMGVLQTTTDASGAILLENGGRVSVTDEGNILVDRITPADKITFDVDVVNESNVSVKYKVKLNIDGELASALTATADGVAIVSGETDWAEWNIAEGNEKTVKFVIELPESVNDDYQEKEAVITYAIEVIQLNAKIVDKWDGSIDTSWYNDTDTEFTLNSANQVAGLAELVDGGNDFVGKTIKLDGDLDLGATDENGETICFDPIGSYRNNKSFKGTFDGQGHTIYNLSQNTWALDNGYYYNDLGMGLFGKVEDATVKNLKINGASISGENGLCGVVAGAAYGDCTFDNITVTNTKCNDYQYYAGGVVGWASGEQTYSNITIDESTILGSQWGDFGNCTGGVIGGASSSAKILIKDSTIACRIDAVNDIVSAYQWHCYRNCGMLIGNTGNTATDDAVTNAAAPNLTCENVTVIYGEWANYTYCEFAGTGYPYVRVQAGVSVDAYSNVRYGHPTDANGNTVVDDNHVHNDGEKHHLPIVFDQLYGGSADQRYCQYGVATHPGVTVIYNNK